MKLRDKALTAVLISLVLLFGVSLFGNIAYPLMWNDEAETAIFAERVLEYGYPKVHDGKNTAYLLWEIPPNVGIDKKSDAYIVTTWGQFYFAAIGAFFARMVDDIYAKTALMRIPFALAGFFGLAVMGLAAAFAAEKGRAARLRFLSGFALLELLSTPLILHLREVRYYSLVLLLFACIFFVYARYRFLGKVGPVVYASSMALLFLAAYNIFVPCYIIFAGTVMLHEVASFFRKRSLEDLIVGVSPVLVSIAALIPLFVFFRTFAISQMYARVYGVNLFARLVHTLVAVSFFAQYEFLAVVLFLKAYSAFLFMRVRRFRVSGLIEESTGRKLRISNFLGLFFALYIIVISNMPLQIIYQRYLIALQPVLMLMLVTDLSIVIDLLACLFPSRFKRRATVAVLLCFILFICALNGNDKFEHVKNHVYEILHRYRGPLDFVIPYIKAEFKDPTGLVIATQYEECAFMYYLGCRVALGYLGINRAGDLRLTPDIIVIRKRNCFVDVTFFRDYYFKREQYNRVSFPVYDYPFNNIPEIGEHAQHLYKTKMDEGEGKNLEIYIRRGLIK